MLHFVESGFLHFFIVPTIPFCILSNHHPCTVLRKEIILCMFHSKMIKSKKDQGCCFFQNTWKRAHLKEEGGYVYIFGKNCTEIYKQSLIEVKIKKC